ncbi:22357_t:CDS:2 [Entrophospora sp. SA101]|nr:6496_t:CDS:2 [Entrophospora sp. SA101]CAJ0632057.1 15446_t:CDS:2 [Entrophospora sp. SA101]CAJ0749873.1 22357_t:CDS:2 [Entrophospora sp. SA101]CAJ0833656.1 7762_t:CDS:2 [Entrophospora sp. SA101]CAJ0890247.1 10209_t:CDS:2 [Entrophospora sp. SA101]
MCCLPHEKGQGCPQNSSTKNEHFSCELPNFILKGNNNPANSNNQNEEETVRKFMENNGIRHLTLDNGKLLAEYNSGKKEMLELEGQKLQTIKNYLEKKTADKEYQKQSQNTKEIIQNAEKLGVKYILNTGQDMPTNRLLLIQLKDFANLFGALGLHPNKLAKKHNLPVLLHIRGEENEKFMDAFTDAYEIVKEVGIKKGILHCFTGNWEIAQKFIDLGFYISFAGNITYQNAKWKEK